MWLKYFLNVEISTFRGRVYTHWFSHMCLILLLAYKTNQRTFKRRSIAFVTGHLFTFLMVLSLICLVTTQILVSGNQTIWRLKILLRTIMAALFITKCNGRFVKNKRYQETGKEYFTIVEMIVKDEGYYYFAASAIFDAWLCQTQPTVCLMILAHPTSMPAHTTFFPIPITTNAKVFLSHNCPKIKWKNLFHKSWKFT